MKKVLKVILPSILMIVLIYFMRGGKDILEGLYIVFPIIYIILGITNSNSKKEWIITIILISIAFLIPINIWFNMGSCIECVLVYSILSFICSIIKNKIKK